MKRIGFLLRLIILTIVLTGCGNKSSKLVCTIEQDQHKATTKSTATVYFDKDGVATKTIVNMVVTASSETIASTLYNTMKDNYDDIKLDGKKITINSSSKSEDNEKLTKEDAIETFETQGFSCK